MNWRHIDSWLTVGLTVAVCCASAQSVEQPNLTVGSGHRVVALHADLAWTDAQQDDGVRGRQDFRPGTAMYFPLRPARAPGIAMDGVFTDLDVAFIRHGRIVKIARLKACPTQNAFRPCPITPSPGVIDAVLETPAGSIPTERPGDPVRVDALNANRES